MKHIIYTALIFALGLTACDSKEETDSSDKKEDVKVEKTEVADTVEEGPIVEALEGVETVCDCYTRTLDLLDRYGSGESGEEIDLEDARLTVACDGIREDVGETAYAETMQICIEADSLSKSIELGDFSACDCVESTMELFEIAESGQQVPDNINLDMDKCTMLKAKMGVAKFDEATTACQENE